MITTEPRKHERNLPLNRRGLFRGSVVPWLSFGLLALAASVPLAARQDKPETRTAWLRRLYATDRCRFGDGLRAVAGVIAGAPVEDSFAALRKRLVDGGVMPDSWDALEESRLTKGQFAYL